MRRAFFIATVLLAMTLVLPAAALAGGPAQERARAQAAALGWLALVDRSDLAGSYAQAHPYLRATTDRAAWDHRLKELRADLGATRSRKLRSVEFSGDRPHPPKDPCYVFVFDTEMEKGGRVEESVTCRPDPAGVWRVSGYFVDLKL